MSDDNDENVTQHPNNNKQKQPPVQSALNQIKEEKRKALQNTMKERVKTFLAADEARKVAAKAVLETEKEIQELDTLKLDL